MNNIAIFREHFDVPAIKRAYDAGDTEILCNWVTWIDIFGGVENAHDAMEDIQWELDIYLEVSDYSDVVINWHQF